VPFLYLVRIPNADAPKPSSDAFHSKVIVWVAHVSLSEYSALCKYRSLLFNNDLDQRLLGLHS
jgi:hypothetical protein